MAILLMVALTDAFAPRQHLPWTPLSLDEPIGLATAAKLERIERDPEACFALLADNGVGFTRAPDRTDGAFCRIENAVRLGRGITPLAPSNVVMTCALAARLTLWDRQVLQPAARDELGAGVTRIDNYGVYACRRIYGQATGRPSEHARAQAFDFAGVRLSDGRRITVARDWSGDGPEARFLRRIRDGACDVFGVTLSPEYNAAHRDHLHLDLSGWRVCR
jgi:hypothetical protein